MKVNQKKYKLQIFVSENILVFCVLVGFTLFFGACQPTKISITENFEIGSTLKSSKDGMNMLYIPAGSFEMGSDTDDALRECLKFPEECDRFRFTNEEPVHTVYLDAFWIDQTEVTNSMYAKCVEAGECEPPSSNESKTRNNYYENSEFDNFPVINVSWHDAQAYCTWADRRLPTETEWEKAASWDEETQQKNIYPWGNSIDCSLANYWGNDNGCVGDTVEVGTYDNGQSPYGVLDMAGNVEEWVADWYDNEYYAVSPSSNPPGPDVGELRVERGGSWHNVTFLQQSTFRSFIDPSWTLNHLGFRCALDAGDDDNGESRDDLIDTLTKVIITPDKEKDQSSTELGNTPTPILPIELSDLDIGSMFVSPLDGTTMFYIPAGEFEMGSNVDEAVYDEKPIHTVYLDAFWIDQTEVTNAMYAKCVGAGRCEPPSSSRSYSRDSYYGIPEFDDYPVIYVSWHDAQAYCAWAGKRLPTEAEWDKAASWDEKNRQKIIYPWGNSIDCSLANYWGREEGCIGDTIEVGSYQDGQSPYGVLDMTGNVIEWVADWYDEEYYAISPPSNPLGPDDGEFRVVRGGSWANPGAMVRVSYRFIPLYPIGSYDSLGFRCALNASVDGKTSIDHIDTPSADFDDGETASGNIVITGVFYNGVNGSQEPDEYVEIRNTGTEAIQLRDWSLIDESHHEFIFPRFIMEPGQICRIYTNEEHREWCSFNYRSTGSAIWNNDGDCAKLRSTDGLVIDEYCY